MRIMFVAPTNSAGGAERVIATLVNYLSLQKHDVHLVNFDKNSDFYQISNNVTVHKLEEKYPGLDTRYRGIKKIKFSLQALDETVLLVKPDVIVAFLFKAEFMSILVGKKRNIAVVTSVRNSPLQYPMWQQAFRRIFYSQISGVVFQSKKVAEYKWFKKLKNKRVISNPLFGDVLKKNEKRDYKKIISVGRLHEQKNHVLLIKAFKNIADEFPEVNLHIFGDGPLKSYLQELIIDIKLEKRVFLEGVVLDAIQKNKDARLFIMTSNYEGFPNALVESMASRIPVICSNFDTGVARELLGNDENGLLFQVNNVNELSEKLRYALSNPIDMEEKAEKAVNVCKKLNINIIGKEWEEFIGTCIIKEEKL